MSTLTQAQADIIISQAQYPHYWCNAQVCGCLGCVNKHGGVQVKGGHIFTMAGLEDAESNCTRSAIL